MLWRFARIALLAAALGWRGFRAAAGADSGRADSGAEPLPPAARELWKDLTGSQSCRECHEEIYDVWKTRDHGMAMLPASAESIRGDFSHQTLKTHDGSMARMYAKDGSWFVDCYGADRKPGAFRVDYTLGFEPIQQYLTRLPDGRIQTLPMTYDVMRKEWYELYAPELAKGDDFNFWLGPMQRWNYMCIDCHNTFAVKNYDLQSRRYDTRWFEINVGCEACHGAGQGHITLMKAGPGAVGFEAIADGYKGKEFTQAQLVDNCGRCHARRRILADGFKPGDAFCDFYAPELLDTNSYYPDGQVRQEDFEYSSFLLAKMCAKGVRCADCHDPHSALRRREGNQLCLECHEARLNEFAHTMHKPESEGALCERCHMPITTYMGRDGRRDHGFTIPTPELTVEMGIPNACNRCHTDKDAPWSIEAMNSHYKERKRKTHPFAQAILDGRGRKSEAAAPLARLAVDRTASPILRASAAALLDDYTTETARQALLRALDDPHPMVAGSAIKSLAEHLDAATAERLVGFLDDPRRCPRLEAIAAANRAAALLSPEARAKLSARRDEYINWLQSQPDDPASHYNLGNFHAEAGENEKALREYRTAEALGMEPAVALWTNLGSLLNAMGRRDEAEKTLLRAVAEDPNFAEGYFNLGLFYGERPDQLSKAIANLKRAVELRPDFARAHYNLGLAYNQARRAHEAVQSLAKALRADSRLFDAAYALATIHLSQGNMAEAIKAARQALEINPQSPDAARILALSLQGNAAEAPEQP